MFRSVMDRVAGKPYFRDESETGRSKPTPRTRLSAAACNDYVADTVESPDGTLIRYRKLGRGPAVILLHGSMESAQSHMGLAQALSEAFTVYLPERRGHSENTNDYSMRKEVEDLSSLLEKTGSHRVFGVSSGGLICLQAALTLPVIHKIALYEPALIVNSLASTALLPRFDGEIAEGNLAGALVTGMQMAQLGPRIFRIMPRWLLESLTKLAMKGEERKARDGDVTMRKLAPTLHYDFQLVAEMAETTENFRNVYAAVLLLGGSKSPPWLKAALDSLETVLPHVRRVEFPGLDHGGSSDISSTNRTGDPQMVATEMRMFFQSQ